MSLTPTSGKVVTLDAIVEALAAAIAPAVARRVLEAMPPLAEQMAQDAEARLGIYAAARLARCRTATLVCALKLPAQHPGHLVAEAARGARPRYRIRTADLTAWLRRGGPAVVAEFLRQRHAAS